MEEGSQFGCEGRPLPLKGGNGVRRVEHEAELGARHGRTGSLHQQGEVGGFDRALQTIPLWSGDAPQLGFRSSPQIEHHQAEIGITRQQVRGLQRIGGVAPANPNDVREEIVGKRRRIERVVCVNQGQPRLGESRGCQNLLEEKVAAATGRGADQFRDGAQWQSAAGLIDRGKPDTQSTSRRHPLAGRKPLGEKVPERAEFFDGGGHLEDLKDEL